MATTHRLHIENLPANLTPDEIKQRFSSFGTVERVDGFNQLNAVGLPNTFCFIELAATEAGLKKCMNTLSGVTWRGNVLRIAPAKPDYRARLEAEAQSANELSKADRRRERRKRKAMASISLEPVTLDNVNTREGWRKSADKQDPIFPITMRPDRPLPPLPVDAERPSKRAKKAAKATEAKEVEPPAALLSRARRVKIDPVRWENEHARGVELERRAKRVKVATPEVKATATAALSSPSSSSSSSESPAEESLAPARKSISPVSTSIAPRPPSPLPLEEDSSDDTSSASSSSPLAPLCFAKPTKLAQTWSLAPSTETGSFALGDLLGTHELTEDDELAFEEPMTPAVMERETEKPVARAIAVPSGRTGNEPPFFETVSSSSRFRLHEGLDAYKQRFAEQRQDISDQVKKRHREALRMKKHRGRTSRT